MKNIVLNQDATPAIKGELEIRIYDLVEDYQEDTFEMEDFYCDSSVTFNTATVSIQYGLEGADYWLLDDTFTIEFTDELSFQINLKKLVTEALKDSFVSSNNIVDVTFDEKRFNLRYAENELKKILDKQGNILRFKHLKKA